MSSVHFQLPDTRVMDYDLETVIICIHVSVQVDSVALNKGNKKMVREVKFHSKSNEYKWMFDLKYTLSGNTLPLTRTVFRKWGGLHL